MLAEVLSDVETYNEARQMEFQKFYWSQHKLQLYKQIRIILTLDSIHCILPTGYAIFLQKVF